MTSPIPGESCQFFLHLVSSAMVRTAQVTDKMIAVHGQLRIDHRHQRNIDCLMACTTCLVCFISAVNSRSKRSLLQAALVAGTQQNLSSMSMEQIDCSSELSKVTHATSLPCFLFLQMFSIFCSHFRPRTFVIKLFCLN